MLKILMITENLHKGGKERRLIELLRYFEKLDIEIKFTLVLLKEILHYTEINSFKKVRLIILPRKIKKDPTIFVKIQKIVREFKPDVIHSWGSMPSIYSFAIAKIHHIPFINAMIADAYCKMFSEKWIRAKITFPFSDVIVSNSYAGLNAFRVPSKKRRVIYNGFNFDRLKNTNPREQEMLKYGIKTKYVVGMIAAFHPRKDYHTFLEGARRICQKRDDITFLAIGDGQDKDYFQNAYRRDSNIIFTGNIDSVESVINILDIGVLLTNPKMHFEGISNSIVEMMAFSKVVIATRGGGTNEIIEDGKSGIFIDPFNVNQMTDKILQVLDNGSDFQFMRDIARHKVAADFNIDTMGLKTLQLYNELLSTN